MAGNRILQNVLASIMEGKGGKAFGGRIQEQAQKDLQFLDELYKKPDFFLSNHAMTNRFEVDGWSPEKIAESFERLMSDASTRGIPNFTGRKGGEALWLDDGVKSIMSPVAPHKNGSIALTLIDPETEKVLKHLESVGWKPGERNNVSPSEYTPGHIGHREGSLRSGSDKFSAVSNQPKTLLEKNDTDSRSKVKALLPYLLGGGASGAAALASPEDAEAVNIGPRGYINLFGKPLNESTPGAFKGAEGMLRYELPDNGMRLTPEFETAWGQSDSAFPAMSFLGDAIEHPDLFKAYPQLGDMDLSAWRTPQGVSGAAYHDSIDAKAPNVPSLLDTITHEYQHGVQGLEGMAVGGSPAMFSGSANPRGEYLRLAGETEARDAASRRTMTPDQRQAQPQTWQNRDDLIVSQPGEGATQQDGRTRLGAFLASAGIDDSMQRNFGLGTRDVLEGLTSLPDGVSNAVNAAMGGSGDYFRLGGAASDWLGLPKEQTPGLSSSIIQSVAGGLPVVPLGLAMQGTGKLPMLGNALASYGKTDFGVDVGLGAALSNQAMRWAFGR